MNEIKFTIPLNPVTKKNSQQIFVNKATGRAIISPSKKYKEYEYACGYYIPCKNLHIDCKVNIKAHFYMQTRRKVDITNLNSALHDILVKYGVIKDDNMTIVIATDGSRVLYDKSNPRTEVTITEMHEMTGFEQ